MYKFNEYPHEKGAFYSCEGSYYPYWYNILDKPHILIAGATGSGKSVLLNTMLYSALIDSPAKKQFFFLDPKKVELVRYAEIPHTIAYVSEISDCKLALKSAISLMNSRYASMQQAKLLNYDGPDVYVVIDELADLILSDRDFIPLISKIALLGRSAKIHLLVCTQCPNRKILPTAITLNITERIALYCQSAIESRQIIGIPGAELLPLTKNGKPYRECLHKSSADYLARCDVPMVDNEEMQKRILYWTSPNYLV